jgi:hypothetical protein
VTLEFMKVDQERKKAGEEKIAAAEARRIIAA